MIIALFPNRKKPQSKNIALGIREYLQKQGASVLFDDKEAESFEAPPISSVALEKIDYFISLGGDGTILRLFQRYSQACPPILGINLGSLGFLAEIPIAEIFPSLQELFEKTAHLQEHLIIQGETAKGEVCKAVNDIVIHRGQNPSLIDLVIHVDGKYLNTFSADGIILSTPCGSTAYSLAAGGPILSSELSALVLTPICAHTISNRPIVFMPKHEIQVQYISEKEPIEISHDGISEFKMTAGEVFTVRPSEQTFKLVKLSRQDEFSILRTKLHWTGKLRA